MNNQKTTQGEGNPHIQIIRQKKSETNTDFVILTKITNLIRASKRMYCSSNFVKIDYVFL